MIDKTLVKSGNELEPFILLLSFFLFLCHFSWSFIYIYFPTIIMSVMMKRSAVKPIAARTLPACGFESRRDPFNFFQIMYGRRVV